MSQVSFSAKSQISRRSTTPSEQWSSPATPAVSQHARRPITQHGVEGMPVAPSSHVQKRTYYDKRYYITSIQSHMNKVREEIGNLKSRTARSKPASASLSEDRKLAKEEAKVYAKYQQQLSVLNIALEMHMSKIGNDQAVQETAEINKLNTSMTEELDKLFSHKTRCEETKTSLEEEIKKEEQKMQLLIEKLPPADILQYESYSKENQKFINAISATQKEIKETQETLAKLKSSITYDNKKQQRIQLLLKLVSCNTHKDSLQAHLGDVPIEQERHALLQQVKDDKADAEALHKVKLNLEEQLKQKNQQLNGLNQELDSKNGARLKKYRDVHVRHAQVNSYIDMFDEVVATIRRTMAEKEKIIALGLDYLLEKTTEENFEEVSGLPDGLQTDNLTDEFKILRTRLTRLTDATQRCQNEEERLKDRLNTMQNEITVFKNIELKLHDLAEETKQGEETQKSLKSVLNATIAAVNEAKGRLQQFENMLEKNDSYREFVMVGKQLEQIELENEKIEEEIKFKTTSEEITKLINEIGEMVKQRNHMLIKSLKNK